MLPQPQTCRHGPVMWLLIFFEGWSTFRVCVAFPSVFEKAEEKAREEEHLASSYDSS